MAKEIDKFFKKKLEERTFEFEDAYWKDALQQIEQADKERASNGIKKWLLGLLFLTMLFGVIFSLQKYTAATQANLPSLDETAPSSKQDHVRMQALPDEVPSKQEAPNDKAQLNVLNTNEQNGTEQNIANNNNTTHSTGTQRSAQKNQNIGESTATTTQEFSTNNEQDTKRETFEYEPSGIAPSQKSIINIDAQTGLSLTYPHMQKEMTPTSREEDGKTSGKAGVEKRSSHNNTVTPNQSPDNFALDNNKYYAKSADNATEKSNNNTFTNDDAYAINSPEHAYTAIPSDQIQDQKSNKQNNTLTKLAKPSIFPVMPLPTKEMAVEKMQDEEKLDVAVQEIPDDPFRFNKKKKHHIGIYASTLIKPKGSDRQDVWYGLKAGVFGRFAVSRKFGIRTELLYSKKGGNLPYAQSFEAKIYSFGSTIQEQILLPTAFHHTELGLHLDYAIHRKHHLGLGINLGYLFVIRGNVAKPVNERVLAPTEKLSRYLSDYALPGSTRIDNEGFDKITPNIQLYYSFNLSKNWQLHIRSNWRTNQLLQNIQSALETQIGFGETTLPTVEDPVKLNFEIGLGYNLFKF